jgi:hypothetical protein
MKPEVPRFLPERLRPQTNVRKRRRGYALLTLVPVILLAFPRWQIAEVVVEKCPELPDAAVYSLHELVGQPTLGLGLQTVRDRVEVWPGVGDVEVKLELPGTVRVRADAAVSCGSIKVGRSWHGVAADGSLIGVAEVALPPILAGFDRNYDRVDGLEVVRRIEAATGGRVVEILRVTPVDFRLRVQHPEVKEEMVIHVLPSGSEAENVWCAGVSDGSIKKRWADLRWPDRIVFGGGA